MTSVVVIPGTGEVTALDAPTETLAEVRDRISRIEQNLRTAKDLLDHELCVRADQHNTRKLVTDGYLVEVAAPKTMEWSGNALAPVLERMVEQEVLSAEAARSALEPELTLKPRARELTRLLASPTVSDEDRQALEDCRTASTRKRSVRVIPTPHKKEA